jgi:hypothetical protein
MLLTILNVIFCISFIGFAYVNLNDGDSWLWVPIYLVAAGLCGAAAFGYYYPWAYIAAISFYLIYAVQLFFSKDGVRGLDKGLRAAEPGGKYAGHETLH